MLFPFLRPPNIPETQLKTLPPGSPPHQPLAEWIGPSPVLPPLHVYFCGAQILFFYTHFSSSWEFLEDKHVFGLFAPKGLSANKCSVCLGCLKELMHSTGAVLSPRRDSSLKAISPLCPPSSQQSPQPAAPYFPFTSSFPVHVLGTGGPCLPQKPKRTFWGHTAVPPARQNPLQPRCVGGGPASGTRQPCGPTLPPLLRTCQGHVSTLPNSEFLITPSMVRLRPSGRTCGLGAARAAGANGPGSADRRLGLRPAERPSEVGGAGRGAAGGAEERLRPASAGPSSSAESDYCLGPGHSFSRVWDLGRCGGELFTTRPPPPPPIHPGFGSRVPGRQTSKPQDSSRAFLALHPKVYLQYVLHRHGSKSLQPPPLETPDCGISTDVSLFVSPSTLLPLTWTIEKPS